jgi:hypothetical protein
VIPADAAPVEALGRGEVRDGDPDVVKRPEDGPDAPARGGRGRWPVLNQSSNCRKST